MQAIREKLENHQISIYFIAVILAAAISLMFKVDGGLSDLINPALAFMLFVTFLQVPLSDLGRAFTRIKFLSALLVSNFVAIPLLVMFLTQFLPDSPMIKLGVLFVLLTPCIDYVVTFSHLGKADARLLLASTPALLILQMLLLPGYLNFMMGESAASLVQIGPFIHAFIWLIAVPLVLAGVVQLWSAKSAIGEKASTVLGLCPVPATAVVLFIVIAALVPQLESALDATIKAVPIYVAFAIIAPVIGWVVSSLFKLETTAKRAVSFSSATRNSLVVLPLALAVPGAIPVIPAVIVTQTVVELISELVYIRIFPRVG
ncbi:arsenic resistance protein [Methylophilus sp. TWE2]|uniref:arsenic resistance protein n=1 Tax=Methylophilus sp. TWE2 TaxID=1662285 RepID=UPI00067166C3|nr:arsenic resistance protein [Methylophilus sp. TWE2]AKR44534.1 arsenic resistance protein [Methylophilus sp. TWE2]